MIFRILRRGSPWRVIGRILSFILSPNAGDVIQPIAWPFHLVAHRGYANGRPIYMPLKSLRHLFLGCVVTIFFMITSDSGLEAQEKRPRHTVTKSATP